MDSADMARLRYKRMQERLGVEGAREEMKRRASIGGKAGKGRKKPRSKPFSPEQSSPELKG